MREEILEPVRRALGWLASLRDGAGRIVCPEHRVEHTGKSACAAIAAAELWRAGDPEGEGLARLAVEQGRRLVANLAREGTSPCHTFRPGRHDPFNCSNAVIDGGAASDALATLVRVLGTRLAAEDREAFTRASLLHARTYLRYAVLDKGVPAQRAWGLTGLAGAWSLEPDRDLEAAAIEAVGVLEAIQHPDGSFPYHPPAWGAPHPGASDVSSFYQSRTTGFLLHALETLGRDPRDPLFRPPLERGLDFLVALQAPDGTKCGLVEAKPWYWGATYEVASHPFDVHALARGWRLFRKPRYAAAAAAAFHAWTRHLSAEGIPASHAPGPGRERSYQCPVFWAAHACWIARAAEDLEAILAGGHDELPARGELDLEVVWFPSAQLGRVEDARAIAWVRGARPGANVHHGSPAGAGIVRAVAREGGELLARSRLGEPGEGEWVGSWRLPSLARGLRANGGELRFSLWLARVHARAGRRREALFAPAVVARRGVLAAARADVASSFELSPRVEGLADGLVLVSGLAARDGTPVPGSRLVREVRVDGEGIVVRDVLESAGAARRVRPLLPDAAREVEREGGEVRYRLGGAPVPAPNAATRGAAIG